LFQSKQEFADAPEAGLDALDEMRQAGGWIQVDGLTLIEFPAIRNCFDWCQSPLDQ